MARYFDGEQARAHEVQPQLVGGALVLRGEDGTVVTAWPVADITVRDGPDTAGTFSLGYANTPARLRLADPRLLRALADAGLRLPVARRWRARHWATLFGALAATVVAGALLLDALPGLIAPLLPASWENRLGGWVEAAMFHDQPDCAGAAGQRALDTLVSRLRADGRINQPVRIAVVDNDIVNALTLPGGRVLVMRGLLDKADDGDEVAGVIAHELGHVAHHDPTTLLLRQLGLSTVAAAFGWNDTLGSAAGLAQSLLTLSYSRRAEAAADAAGEQFLTAAGLRADGLGRFFARLQTLGDRGPGVSWLATHPPTEERREHASRSSTGAPAFSAAEWDAVRAMCR